MTEVAAQIDLRRLNEHCKRFVYRLSSVMRNARIYDLDNAVVTGALEALELVCGDFVDDLGSVRLLAAEDTVYVNDFRVRLDKAMVPHVADVAAELNASGVGGFELDAAVGKADWTLFLRLLERSRDPTGDTAEGAPWFNAALADAGVTHLRLAPVMQLHRGKVGSEGNAPGSSIRMQVKRSVHLYLRGLAIIQALYDRQRIGRGYQVLSRLAQAFVELAADEPRHHLALITMKDDHAYLPRHALNRTILAIALGQRLGLSRGSQLDLAVTSLTVDLGMTLLPTALQEAGRIYDEHDRVELERHPLDSARLAMEGSRLDLPVRRRILVGFEHHLGFDLGGYPTVLQWPEQHLFSRILAVCECYDALTTGTAWSGALLADEALGEMVERGGTSLDPVLVRSFVNMLGRWPLGTCVLLTTGEVGVVFAAPEDPSQVHQPIVRLLLDSDGRALRQPRLLDLRRPGTGGQPAPRVARSVDAAELGIDVKRALLG